jgi:hypothetical protein
LPLPAYTGGMSDHPKPTTADLSAAVQAFRNDLTESVRDWVSSLAEGSSEDLSVYATQIALDLGNLLTVPEDRRDSVRRELLGQVGLLAEKQRVRFSKENEALFRKALQMLGSIASIAAGALSAQVPALVAAALTPLSKE